MAIERVHVLRWVVAGLVALTGCAAKPPAFVPPVQAPVRHRPFWLRSIAGDIDGMVQCLDGLEDPAYVLLVHHDPNRVVAMTTVDAFGGIEHCVVDGGRVVLRQPAEERLADFEGLPLFALGAARPVVAASQVLEEVVSEGIVLGWLHWPSSGAEAQAGQQPFESN